MSAKFSSKTTIKDLLTTYPGATPVLVGLRIGCVGCWMQRFCTLEEVACNYALPLDSLLEVLQQVTSTPYPKE